MIIPPPPPPSRILGLTTRLDSAAYYRLCVPLRAIGGSWAALNAIDPEQLGAAETVIVSRLGGRVSDVRDFLADLRLSWGIRRILLDYDDAIFVRHPVTHVRPSRIALDGVRYALQHADGVIASTERLKRYFTRYTALPIAVVPNYVAPQDWPEPAPVDTPPVIVLAGSPSHEYDWNLVVPALAFIRKHLGDVQLRLLGCAHPLLKQIATQGGRWFHDVAEYRQALAGGAIGLCPLPNTRFNRHKTPVKALEYAMSGMAVIASPLLYADVVPPDGGVIVADDDPCGWAVAIGQYLADPRRRTAHAAALRAHVLQRYDVAHHTNTITHAYEEVLTI